MWKLLQLVNLKTTISKIKTGLLCLKSIKVNVTHVFVLILYRYTADTPSTYIYLPVIILDDRDGIYFAK